MYRIIITIYERCAFLYYREGYKQTNLITTILTTIFINILRIINLFHYQNNVRFTTEELIVYVFYISVLLRIKRLPYPLTYKRHGIS